MPPPAPAAQQELQSQIDLLRLEYEYEKDLFREQTEKAGVQRNVRQGLCWFPVLTGKCYYNSLNQFVVVIERRADQEVEHNFEHGRPVCFFTEAIDGRLKYFEFTGTISYVEGDKMIVVLPTPEAYQSIQGVQELGVQLFFDETSYRTMVEALSDVIRAKENRLAELRDISYGKRPPSWRTLFPMRFPWLNGSQESAVNKVLEAKDICIVHGPPGTGKTTTLVEAVFETLHRENQVMVCAQSNTAVDWIAEKLIDRGIAVLRIGNPTRVNDKMLSFTYERRFESHPDYSELWAIRKAIRDTQASLRRSSSRSDKDTVRNRLSRLRFRATELELKIDSELFAEARVIACTLTGSANHILMNRQFTSLFIDEAAQAMEAACWIAIRKADRVILAGDHHQLPPTVKCMEAARGGLDKTLMQKLSKLHPEAVILLTLQYRMNEEIMRFPSRWFYHNRLEAAPEVRHRGILQLDTPIEWVDTTDADAQEEVNPYSLSRLNKEEAQLLISYLTAYITKIGKERLLEEQIDFGIISPYRAQVHYLRGLIRRNAFFKPFRQLITIHTVDGFQGQERDVILISLVRANAAGQIGFLHDLRRMNVAITRARMKLIILGNVNTLTKHPFYQALYEYIEEINES